mgnify:CR=1 FL=1
MSEPLALYVHVPFCSSRCGYCDFNTYTATELGNDVRQATFNEVLMAEIRQARAHLGPREVTSVFFGGGTPTLLDAEALTLILREVDASFDLVADAEVTTEANPDSVDEAYLATLRAGGFTRISFGMQSLAPHVLRTLDRTHAPEQSIAMARAARRVGFDHVNVDLIYGTPGERDDDVRASLDAVLDAGVDHVSAYALIVEQGTPLDRRIRRGEVPEPDDDIAAERYELIDERLNAAGLPWYEVSNWARPGGECRHNVAYWRNADWWGIGPGAHSHVDGVRWWNVKHPRTYAERVASIGSPIEDREVLSADDRRMEEVMLSVRLREGLALDRVPSPASIPVLVEDGLVAVHDDRVVLTRHGRLLANRVIASLVG